MQNHRRRRTALNRGSTFMRTKILLGSVGCWLAISAWADTGATSVLYTFTGQADGNSPQGALVGAPDGSIFGTTEHQYAGESGGTAYQVSPTGALTTFAIAQQQGEDPVGGLTLGPDGNFYGVAIGGGNADDGSVYRVTPAGVITALHDFSGPDGAQPWSTLTVGRDGKLYGTTYQGGTSGYGTIFRMSLDGTFETLYSFTDLLDGGYPESGVVEGPDGSLYGLAAGGGALLQGTAYRLYPNGKLLPLAWFGALTSVPTGNLVLGHDGTLYGTVGGSNPPLGSYGQVFAISPVGIYYPLHVFSGTDGSMPSDGGLTMGHDGKLYGATLTGGANGVGTVYSVGTDGTFSLLHSFATSDGAYPSPTLLERQPGVFIGTTTYGGTFDAGVIFQLTVTPAKVCPAPLIAGSNNVQP